MLPSRAGENPVRGSGWEQQPHTSERPEAAGDLICGCKCRPTPAVRGPHPNSHLRVGSLLRVMPVLPVLPPAPAPAPSAAALRGSREIAGPQKDVRVEKGPTGAEFVYSRSMSEVPRHQGMVRHGKDNSLASALLRSQADGGDAERQRRIEVGEVGVSLRVGGELDEREGVHGMAWTRRSLTSGAVEGDAMLWRQRSAAASGGRQEREQRWGRQEGSGIATGSLQEMPGSANARGSMAGYEGGYEVTGPSGEATAEGQQGLAVPAWQRHLSEPLKDEEGDGEGCSIAGGEESGGVQGTFSTVPATEQKGTWSMEREDGWEADAPHDTSAPAVHGAVTKPAVILGSGRAVNSSALSDHLSVAGTSARMDCSNGGSFAMRDVLTNRNREGRERMTG